MYNDETLGGDSPMALIWLLKPGEGQRGPAFDNRSLEFCFNELGLRQRDRINKYRRLIKEDLKRSLALGPRYAVVELLNADLNKGHPGWETGYYYLRIDATEAREILERTRAS